MALLPFRRTEVGREPLPVAMSGVRVGERVLQIDVDDPRIAGAIAAKSGLSGHAAIVVPDDQSADRARAAAASRGVALDVHVAALDHFPFDNATFDTVVLHNVGGRFGALSGAQRARSLREVHRVLRRGGRVVVLDFASRSGLTGLLRRPPASDSRYASEGGSVVALEQAGFHPVRVLAERDGYRFSEGLKARA